ncbi:MAG: tetratricopeptide repeat protein, partial [Planctomycetota bacterium]
MAIDPAAVLDAAADIEWAAAAAPDHARAQWMLGTLRHAQGSFDEALTAFEQAADLDPMPWRATTGRNDALRRAADQRGTPVADLQAIFRAASPGSSVGWELMDDHVHPSVEGHALLARGIVQSMTQLSGDVRVDPAVEADLPGPDVYLERLGDNIFDRFGVAARMRALFNVPLFKETNPWAFELMNDRVASLEAQMSEAQQASALEWLQPQVNQQYSRALSGRIGKQMVITGDLASAERLFTAAERSINPYTDRAIEYAYLKFGSRAKLAGTLTPEVRAGVEDALLRADIMLRNSASHEPVLHRFSGELLQMLGRHEEALRHLGTARQSDRYRGRERVDLEMQLLESLLATGRRQDALALIDNGIANAGPFSPIYVAQRARVLDSGGQTPPDEAGPRTP